MKGSKGIESVPVGAVTLYTEGDALIVSVEHDGRRVEILREPWAFAPEDGQIYHSVTANGLSALFEGEHV